MIDYLYDGTFEGLLTCIYHHYYGEKASGIFKSSEYQSNMLGGCIEVVTDAEKAKKVYDAIEQKISKRDLRRVYKAYLSSDESKESKILRYVVLGFKVGGKVSMMHGSDIVADIQAIEKKIDTEAERMRQFVRFSVLEGGVMYACIEPDNDILELIADHFCDRFKNEPFIIRDKKREKALAAFEREWYITPFDPAAIPQMSDDEKEYRRLWKNYFDNIAIKERKNLRCQSHFIPQRYRKYLTEMNTLL